MELYVPITFFGESRPTGVIETYYKLDNVNNLIAKAQFTITTFMVGVLVILLLLL